MGVLDGIKRAIGSAVRKEAVAVANKAVSNIGKSKSQAESFTFGCIPANVSELQAFPEAKLDTAFKTAALVMIALARYETSIDDCFAMLDYMKGPESLSNYEKSFIKERLTNKTYKVRSYFKGATITNGYSPSQPYTIEIKANPYSFDNENWATLWVKSSGADNERQIKLRHKPSTGEWFLNEIQCLSDVRPPASEDPWA